MAVLVDARDAERNIEERMFSQIGLTVTALPIRHPDVSIRILASLYDKHAQPLILAAGYWA